MSPVWTLIIGWLSISSLIEFILMGIDKARAHDDSWRIPESVFFRLALVGGAFGIIVGSSLFRHKTQKVSFVVGTLVVAVVWIVALLGLSKLLGPPFS